MNPRDNARDSGPWYREPWPWLLMLGPFIVVVAGTLTAWIAFATNDGLVTDDYYRKGLAANLTIAQSERAERLGVEARVRFAADALTLRLSGKSPDFVAPARLKLLLSHPTRAGLDQEIMLEARDGLYVGGARLPRAGHWLILVEDEAKQWRLLGNAVLPMMGEVVIGGEEGAKASAASDLR